MVLNFPVLADYAILALDGLNLYATHGHNYNTKTPPPLAKGDILLHGHTHVIRAEKFGDENTYMAKAKEYADELVSVCGKGLDFLPFSVDKKDSWSLKYNLVWDILFDFNLFDKAIYKAESEKYRIEMNTYGTPLDYRRTFTKTDWELWAACLDETQENIGLLSKCICDYLADTEDRNCFSDWVETKKPKQSGFDHRTVQAGLWMPVLFSKFGKF